MLSKRVRTLLVVTVLCISLLLLEVLFRRDIVSLRNPTTRVWKSMSSSNEFYVIDSEWVSGVPELKGVLKESRLDPVPKKTLKSMIEQKLIKSDNTFLKAIEDDIVEQYTEKFKASLKASVEADLKEQVTKKKFEFEVISYKLLEQLRAIYLKENKELLKSAIIKEFLTGNSDESSKSKIDSIDTLCIDRGKYFQNIIASIMGKFNPDGNGITHKGISVPSNGLKEVTNPPKSRKELTFQRVKVTPEEFSDLQEKHDAYVAFLRALSIPPMEIYSGDGIVLVAGKKHIIGALNVIIQLREMGSELPVELVLDSKDDYNKKLCEKILPRLNGKCLIIESILSQEIYKQLQLDGFPMKVIALVVSSFDNTIYLDSDTFPIKNVDALLVSQAFRETRFILWPDNWHKGTSPIFYDIVRLTAGEPIRRDGLQNEQSFSSYISLRKDEDVLFHDLDGIPPFTSIESGQLVFSKREHFRSLFLSLYYNVHGSTYYYPLLFQGVFGSGDRETFVPAFHVMNEPYYITEWVMNFTGVVRTPQEVDYFDESTMVQFEPDSAAKFRKAWRSWLFKKELDSRLDPFQNGEFTSNLLSKFFEENIHVTKPEPFFLHVHSPKINGLYNEISEESTYDYEARYIREIGKFDDVLGLRDWELQFQAINAWSTCEAMNEQEFWNSFSVSQELTCQKLTDYVNLLKRDSNNAEAANIKILQHLKKIKGGWLRDGIFER